MACFYFFMLRIEWRIFWSLVGHNSLLFWWWWWTWRLHICGSLGGRSIATEPNRIFWWYWSWNFTGHNYPFFFGGGGGLGGFAFAWAFVFTFAWALTLGGPLQLSSHTTLGGLGFGSLLLIESPTSF